MQRSANEGRRRRLTANTARDGGMPVALAGAMAAAKAAIPGAEIAAKRARKGQATTVRAKKRVGAAPSRSAQAALEASSRQVEANRGPVCPRAPIGDRTCGLRVDRGVPSLLRYPTVAFRARPLAALVPTALACLPSMLGGWSSRADGRRRCWTAGRCEAWADAGTGGRRERRGGAKKRAAWWWRCCWPSGARVALASQLACT